MNFSDPWYLIQDFTSTSDGVIYIGFVDTTPHSNGGAVFKSENLGYDWISAGSNAITSSLSLDNNEYVYAGTGAGWSGSCQGIIRTTNSGSSWESFNSGLPQGSCGHVLACNSGGILFTGTETGVYRTIESTTDINEYEEVIPSEFALYQNYPNPFNPSTTIKYQLPQSGKVTLKVYDILGEEIRTLVNEGKAAGNYEVNFDASVLKSGVYFYSLQTESFRDTKKMILIK
ncbi:MAG: T9SS type A sorting domain-containing protein [Ignavibacteria bacterium]|nr:T9SS type A sorting domain-containing protein [Ignavibacteria bacterium]